MHWWAAIGALSGGLAACYLAICFKLLHEVWRTHRISSNRLALATAAVFVTGAVHYGSDAVYVLLAYLGVRPQVGMSTGFGWPSALVDLAGATVAICYLGMHGDYGRLLNGPRTSDEAVHQTTEERLRAQALTDALTGLPNRAAFNIRIAALATAHSGPVAVLFLNLDRFKMINDTLGHPVGDEVLAAAATRLSGVLRSGDQLFRVGGDEFTVVSHINAEESETVALSRRLASTLATPFAVYGREMSVSFSIGIAIGRGPETIRDLMRRADVAMYEAKASGGATERVFHPSMSDHGQGLTLFNDLSLALQRQEFVLSFQPIVRLATAEVVGAEALVRWQHPDRGQLLPADFVPFAEETGQIVPLGRWVLATACAAATRWAGPGSVGPYVTVNVSAGEVEHPDFLESVSDSLAKAGLAPERLRLEVTEQTAGRDPQLIESRLTALDQLGVRVVLDDFGTGWASLSHLDRFPVQMLKIDRSFVGAEPTSSGAAVVRSVVMLGKALNIDCVAEGVETVDQLNWLTALGCAMGQGFLLGRPMGEKTLRDLLFESGQRTRAGRPPGGGLSSVRTSGR